MTKKVRKLYNAATMDLEFMNQLMLYERIITRDVISDAIVASIYMGYLIAKGEYNESDYK